MADTDHRIGFGPFRADLGAQCLFRGREPITLRPKTWEVLRYLLERPGRLVTKGELLDQVWAGTIVSEGTLTQSIRELRSALDDDSKRPRFIATVHRRGYRFIAELGNKSTVEPAADSGVAAESLLIGRDRELAQLHEALAATLRGQRRSVFVTGDAGIGKTALLDEFTRTAGLRHADNLVIVHGQCVEQRGEAEPYLPVLEALNHLCNGSDGAQAVEVLRRYAPTWLVQMPWLLAPADLESLRQQLMGTGSERMLRELGVAMDQLAGQVPLVVVLEDLHWSDLATVDLLAALARRRGPTPLLLLGSLRTSLTDGHKRPLEPVLRELSTRGDAIEIALDVLSPDAARTYVMRRLDDKAPAALVDAIQRHSGGSPLFLVTALAYALARNWVVLRDGEWQLEIEPADLETAIPAGLRQLIEVQIAGLEREDRTLLEGASVAGMEISPHSLAVAMGQPADEMVTALDGLSRRFRFIRRAATVDTSTSPTGRFEFTHALYQQVLYAGTAPTTRRHLHLQIARGLQLEHSDRGAKIAAELAMHFERAGTYDEAARYLGLAALNAHTRAANRESAVLLEHALGLIAQIEDSPRRQRREADLCIQLGAVRGSIYGRGAEQYITPFQRAWELSRELDDVPRMFLARMAAFGHFGVTEQLSRGEEVCHDLIALAARAPMPDIVAVANAAMGSVLIGMGRLEESRQHLERALATLNPHDPSTQLFRRLEDPEILCLTGLAWVLAQLGFPDQARRRCEEAIEIGRARAPYHHVYGLNAAAILDLFLDKPNSCLGHAESALALAREHGFDGFLENATVLASWGRERTSPRAGAWQRLQRDVDAYRRCNQRFGMVSYQVLVAEAALAEGNCDAGFTAIAAAEAMMGASGERAAEGNLLRIKALLLAATGASESDVESTLVAAADIARQREAKLQELRAAIELARLWTKREEPARAREMLAATYGWFTEGFDAPDLQRARALLTQLTSS